jgi:two-component system OmpR family sensor kinase
MSLRTRLLLSYLVLLGVTLSVIFGALLLIVSRQPEPISQRYGELIYLVRSFSVRQLASLLREPAFPSLRDNRLEETAEEYDKRVILLEGTGANGIFVEYDSEGIYPDSDHFLKLGVDLEATTYYRLNLSVPEFVSAGMAVGSFTDPNSVEWLFVSVKPRNSNYTLVLADINPGRSLRSTLAGFGTSLGNPLLQSAVVGLVVALLLATFTSRAFTGTLQKIALAAKSVAEGHYDQTLPPEGPAEIRAVAEAFNQMTEEVQKNQQAQRDFLANITHDLKTPLTSIQGYSQAITDGTAKDAVKAAAIINDEAARMVRLVSDLTELSRLHSGAATLRIAMEDVNQIVSAVIQRLAVVAQHKGITVQTDLQPLPPIPADGDRLAQVFTNLIGNALTYTPPQGTVNIITRKVDEPVSVVEITVQDNGIGIPLEELGRIFERFYQVDKARGPKRGTGLGLAITREIVTAHHGDISVTSAGENQGASFTVRLPLSQHENTGS